METTGVAAATGGREEQHVSSPAPALEEHRKRRRLNVTDEQAHARVESILREQLDLELYMKQKEVNTISSRLKHSEALLEVLESAIQSQQNAAQASDDAADGFLSYFHNLSEFSHSSHEQLDRQQFTAAGGAYRERPRRAAAAPARYSEDYYHGTYAQSTDDEGGGGATAFTGRSNRRRTPARTPRFGTLATRLDPEQMSSVTDALDFISKRRDADANADSSAGESESDSWSNGGNSKHHAQLTGAPVLVQPARESRFHIIRRVMLGNTSQFFDPQSRPLGKERSTHKWTLYIRNAPTEDHIGSYIRKARVFLHPSYRPDDIVDLSPPRFELTRWGWGEFPARVQIFFRDKRNKPVDLVHILKLDDMCSGIEVLGSETPIDLELDRRGFTDSGKASEYDSPALRATLPKFPPPPANPPLRALVKALCSLYPLLLSDIVPPDSQPPETLQSDLGTVPAAEVGRWKWCVADTVETWRSSWPIGKRLLSEYTRNRALQSLFSAALSRIGVHPDAVDSCADSPSATKELAERVFRAVLGDGGADETTVSKTAEIVCASDSTACKDAVEMVCLWAGEFVQSRPLRPDRTRGLQQKTYAWSLKRWLRSNGFVPLPILSHDEQQACILDQITASDLEAADDGDSLHYPDNCIEGDYADNKRSSSYATSLFCNTCGAKHDNPSTGEPTSAAIYCSQECESTSASAHTTATNIGGVLTTLPKGWDASEDEGGAEVILSVDDDINSNPSGAVDSVTHAKIKSIAVSLRRYHLEQQCVRNLVDEESYSSEHGEALVGADDTSASIEDVSGKQPDSGVDDEAIDWIWSIVRPLELNCATASRLSITNSDDLGTGSDNKAAETQIRLPNGTDEALGEALDQRLVVGRLLLDVTKLFLRDLVAASDKTMRSHHAARIAEDH
ncbi:hypothetical protein IWW50_002850, partial [Coemansia erecta]